MGTSLKGVGIPVKLLHEAAGHVVTIELKSGEAYRGELFECEDNWNCQLKDVTATARDGRVSKMEHIFVRGSRIRLLVVPDMLKNAPMFKRIDPKNKGKKFPMGAGGGTAAGRVFGRGRGRGRG
jgi:small nuclear ribonucleoprotein D3